MKLKSLIIVLAIVYGAFGNAVFAQPKKLSRQIVQPTAAAPNRLALVIGNGEYRSVSRLNNAVKDALDMSKALRELGFEVSGGENLSADAMKRAILEFGERLGEQKGIGVFYYAGHGVQLNGRNYLIPVEANALREQTIEFDAVDVNRVLAEMDAAGNGLNLVILDACRNNPFTRSWRGGGTEGLASISAPSGTLIAYATAPGEVASDGKGENGLYTAALLKWMREPDLKVEEMFKSVRVEVVRGSQSKQTPWESSSLQGDFYFNPKTVKQAVADALKSETPVKPDDKLKVKVNPASGARPKYKGKLLTFSFETPYLKDIAANLFTEKKEVGYFIENLGKAVDLEMIEIRGGTFTMGSTPDQARKAWQKAQEEHSEKYSTTQYKPTPPSFERFAAETPARAMTIKPFFMSKYEVTMAQWKAVMSDLPEVVKGVDYAEEKKDDYPVYGINWVEAKKFCERLSQKTGKKYRLPTEAEWEYAARAGGETAYAFGDTIDRSLANFGGPNAFGLLTDLSVARFYPNAFGLYQMHGNVDEMCEDVWNADYQNAPTDGSARKSGATLTTHVIRGGNFTSLASECRSAARDNVTEDFRDYNVGFRIVGEVQ